MKFSGWPRWVAPARSLTFCLIAVALALQGERVVREQSTRGVPMATLWFSLGIVALVAGIWGTYRRYSLTSVPRSTHLPDGNELAVARTEPGRGIWRIPGMRGTWAI